MARVLPPAPSAVIVRTDLPAPLVVIVAEEHGVLRVEPDTNLNCASVAVSTMVTSFPAFVVALVQLSAHDSGLLLAESQHGGLQPGLSNTAAVFTVRLHVAVPFMPELLNDIVVRLRARPFAHAHVTDAADAGDAMLSRSSGAVHATIPAAAAALSS